MSTLKVDLALVEKYNQPGPRYTSYPPATKFTEGVTWDALRERIVANNQTERGLSLYFHIPFCETRGSLQQVIEQVVDNLLGEGIIGEGSTGIGLRK